MRRDKAAFRDCLEGPFLLGSDPGEMAERLNAPVLKTGRRDERLGGSNPPLSAIQLEIPKYIVAHKLTYFDVPFVRLRAFVCWRLVFGDF